ncbi:Pre-mRNA-processing factor 39 [Hordeum vulgare]|nr:Pre-mRNA-processing factor 39 [Hordeum vulgare]
MGLVTPSPLVVHDEGQEAEAAYQKALAAILHESEEEKRQREEEEEEEEAYQARLTEGMAVPAVNECVVLPLVPSSLAKVEPRPTVLKTEQYVWDRVVREWVSVPPVWLGATPEHEHTYMDHWEHRRLVEERLEGERLEQLERDAEAEDGEHRAEAQLAAVQPPTNDVAAA